MCHPNIADRQNKNVIGLVFVSKNERCLSSCFGAGTNVQRPKEDMRPLPALPARLNPLDGPGDEWA
jgi:hypothetical protein